MANIPTIELIHRAQTGDPAAELPVAVSAIYERYHLRVFRYLVYRVGDLQAAEDLTSEVFLRLIAALPGYRPQSVSFGAWLFQIARNLAIDHYRKTGGKDHVELEENLMDETGQVEASVEHGLTSQTLRRALRHLNDEQRDVVVMRFVIGMPITEVAEALHKSDDAVKGLQRRALLSLRAILTDWEVSYA